MLFFPLPGTKQNLKPLNSKTIRENHEKAKFPLKKGLDQVNL
jgi:hypothetical protein